MDQMHHSTGLALVIGIFVVFPVVLFFGLRSLERRWIKPRSSSPMRSVVTPAGYLLHGSQVVFLLGCAVNYELEPTGPLGASLHTVPGLVLVLLGSTGGFALAAVILARLGYPTSRVTGPP
jgi:hypothetical protein